MEVRELVSVVELKTVAVSGLRADFLFSPIQTLLGDYKVIEMNTGSK